MANFYDELVTALQGGGTMPEGVNFDSRAPQGMTIADPAQREAYAAGSGRQAAGIAQQNYLDNMAANQLKMLGPLLQQVHGLDPQLQGFLLSRLGMPGAPKVQDPKAQQLQNQLLMATYKNEMGQGQHDIQNEGMMQRLELAKQHLEALNQQRTASNELAQQQTALKTQTARMPTMPFKEANKLLLDMASSGATPEQMQTAAEAMGYAVSGTRPTGGFLGIGQTQIPVLGIRHPTGASTAAATAPVAEASSPAATGGANPGEVVVEKDGKRFAVSPSKLQAAIKQGYKLIQ